MVLMSRVKIPIVSQSFSFGEHHRAPSRLAAHADMFDLPHLVANRWVCAMFLSGAKTLRWGTSGTFAGLTKASRLLTGRRLDSGNTATYLEAWPRPMRDSPSLCQGLHKQRFLPYVSGLHSGRMIASGGRQRRCGPAGRMNGSAIGHAEAWLQGTDRLETGRNCRQPRHYRLCDYDPRSHAEGHRYRRHAGGADRHPAPAHRARDVVRRARLLHPDVL